MKTSPADFHLYGATKPPLTHNQLREVIDLSLWAGQLLLQNGAETERIEETVHRLGTALGCDWLDVSINSTGVLVTASSGDEFRTKTRRVVRQYVNMATITAVNELSRDIAAGRVDAAGCRRELRRITEQPHLYNRWLTALAGGVACAALSLSFGAAIESALAVAVGTTIALIFRQELIKRQYNTYMVVILTSAAGALITGAAFRAGLIPDAQQAVYASALALIPGVQLINSVSDILKGYTMMGIARGITGAFISLAIALGLMIAVWLVGVPL
jgi:uncharacterized membrane protein YjjP (DUF1212 family)